MERNFFRRIEVAFPVERKKLKERIIRDLEGWLADNMNAWMLLPDGTYARTEPGLDTPFSAQQTLLERHAAD